MDFLKLPDCPTPEAEPRDQKKNGCSAIYGGASHQPADRQISAQKLYFVLTQRTRALTSQLASCPLRRRTAASPLDSRNCISPHCVVLPSREGDYPAVSRSPSVLSSRLSERNATQKRDSASTNSRKRTICAVRAYDVNQLAISSYC